MREYLKDEDIVTPAFLELIDIWWLPVNSKERFHPHHFGNAISPNTLTDKRIFKRDVDISGLTVSSTDEIHKLTSDFLTTLPTDSIDLLYLSDNSEKILLHMWQGTFLIRLDNIPTVMLV